MKMLIPDSIMLNARRIDIVKSQDKPFDVRTIDIKDNNGNVVDNKQVGLMGYFNPDKSEIGITELSKNNTFGEQLFFHEVIEAIDSHEDFGLSHSDITTIGNNIHQVFQQLFDYSTKGAAA